MKIAVGAVFILCFSLLTPICSGLDSIENPDDQDANPGDVIEFNYKFINEKNYPIDALSILYNVELNTSFLVQDEFLNVSRHDIICFTVILPIPLNITVTTINFSIEFYERPSFGHVHSFDYFKLLKYQMAISFNSTINICFPSNSNVSFSSYDFVILLITISTFITISFVILHKSTKKNIFELISNIKPTHFPLFRLYTRLRRDRLLRNNTRKNIMNLLKDRKHGATFKEIQNEMGISHPSYLNYHLRRLMEFEFVKSIDNHYYSQGATLKRPFITEIRDAIMMGARTPTEVANEIRSYPQKVRYHMKKHGLLHVCDVDYSKRKR